MSTDVLFNIYLGVHPLNRLSISKSLRDEKRMDYLVYFFSSKDATFWTKSSGSIGLSINSSTGR
jgi:hypothetical protein